MVFRLACLFGIVDAGGQDAEAMLQVSQVGDVVGKMAVKLVPWNQLSILGEDGENQCDWQHGMCLRQYSDQVSDHIKRDGKWSDCDALQVWWKHLPDRFNNSAAQGTSSDKLFVDIGSNIGACLFPMAARSDVPMAMAFEPNPKNLFYLTSTVLGTPQTKNHIVLYPYALGDEDADESIYMEHGNAGNSVVGTPTNADSAAVATVPVVKLDEIFMTGSAPPPYIHLMKIDAQGFEVKILKGAKNLFAAGAVNAVKFELATTWLENQGTSSVEYINDYLSMGFEIFDPEGMEKLQDSQLNDIACGEPVVMDLMAVYKLGLAVTQHPVRC